MIPLNDKFLIMYQKQNYNCTSYITLKNICFFARTTTKLVSDNTGAYLQISKLQYQMGELEEGLR